MYTQYNMSYSLVSRRLNMEFTLRVKLKHNKNRCFREKLILEFEVHVELLMNHLHCFQRLLYWESSEGNVKR